MIQAYTKIFAIGTNYIRDIFNEEVEISEKIDGCVTPDTRILTYDLRHKKAGDLKIGDMLIGFSEQLNRACFVPSQVTIATPIKKTCYQIETESGSVIASSDHPWVVRFPNKTSNGLSKDYVTTENLQNDMEILCLGTWNEERTWDAGYIAGQLDGEGALVGRGKSHNTVCLSYTQKAGSDADRMEILLKERGFLVSRDERKRKDHWKEIVTLCVRGGWVEVLRCLGSLRPYRLLDKAAEKVWLNAPLNGVKTVRVLSVEPCGEKEVIGLSTTSKTYIANGMLSHNSQFAFGKIKGELFIRSKGTQLFIENPEKMFLKGIDYVAKIQDIIPDNMIFYCEYLNKPKHNTLVYDRVPKNHLMLFGVMDTSHKFDTDLKKYSDLLDIEPVPIIYSGKISNVLELNAMLERESVLGKAKIEGIVVKNYHRQFLLGGQPMPLMAGKFVSEQFKEVHRERWGLEEKSKSRMEIFFESFRTEARWDKAVQHLSEKGKLKNEPSDIGNLMKEISEDIEAEEKEAIKEFLWNEFSKDLKRKATAGVAEWYKQKLLSRAL